MKSTSIPLDQTMIFLQRLLKPANNNFPKHSRFSRKTPTTIAAFRSFKNQFIAPIDKKDSKLDPANYQPISLTLHVIKIFERAMRKNLVRYLEDNNLISNKQHGFRKGRSCLTQLLKHYDKILNNYLNNADTDVIYLDYTKAFDTCLEVDYQVLLKKLHHYGIGGKVYD